MSIEVIKAGLQDTFQDAGRFGYQHLGINPTGAMDLRAMQIANALVGNEPGEAVLEYCFPGPSLLFNTTVLIALSGADLGATISGKSIPPNHPVLIPSNTVLKFSKSQNGSFGYLAVRGGFLLQDWLGSKSTHTKAKAGGWEGRSLKKGDIIPLRKSMADLKEIQVLPWLANVSEIYSHSSTIRCMTGNEYSWLSKKSQSALFNQSFELSLQSDRMGYRLNAKILKQTRKEEMVSTALTFGTVQLLPNGQLIILMADHQTTGGYPRVAHVISADRSALTQFRPNEKISFQLVSIEEAEKLFLQQNRYIQQLKTSCRLRLNDYNRTYVD